MSSSDTKATMFLLSFISLVCSISAFDFSNSELGSALQLRDKRQSYTYYYLCGNYPNQYLSYTPCSSTCTNCNSCNTQYCSTTQYCQQFNTRWTCQNGCCRVSNNPPATTRSPPVCGGREVSGGYCRSGSQCDSGFLCTSNNVCCRCAYGTSIGPCVNLQCPNNYQCNANNECCPYQVGK